MNVKHAVAGLALLFLAFTGLAQTANEQTTVPEAHQAMHHRMDHDVMFADMMTKHHQDGILMAKMAVEKAQSSELRSMAQKMIDDQQREIDEMQRLRGNAPKMSMSEMKPMMPGMMPESAMQKDMARLQSATGREFDAAFTEIMPRHHEGAITMAKHELARGDDAAMKAVAQAIADRQSREREQMLALHRHLSGNVEPMTSSASERLRMTKD